jgi:hypothetical protein
MLNVVQRFVPSFNFRFLLPILLLGGAVALAATFVRWGDPIVELDLVILGPDGQFHESLELPNDWADTDVATTDGVVRFPLILAVRNVGHDVARADRLVLRLPARFRLTGAGGEDLGARFDPATPLVTYVLETGLDRVEPGRLPTLLPVHESLWLEVIIPRFYCVALAEAIPEFIPAPAPPQASMSDIRLFYALESRNGTGRQTGVMGLRFDPAHLAVAMPAQPPSFPMISDTVAARPELAALRLVGSRQVRCGEPEAPMEMLSTVWETEGGARLIALDYAGAVRKHLFDLNGDGVIDRESWDPEGTGRFSATRRASFPTPEFLLPPRETREFDMATFEGIPEDSLARLDPLRAAMRGPGPPPIAFQPRRDTDAPMPAAPGAATPGEAMPRDAIPGAEVPEAAEPAADPAPRAAPPPRRPQPLGRPAPPNNDR